MTDESRHESRANRNFSSDFYRVLARTLVALATLGLAAFLAQLHWTGVPGNRVVIDFLVFPTAGGMANTGHAIDAYDRSTFHRALAAAAGHDFAGDLPFKYPPQFFLLASVLAGLPYPVAYWGFATVSWMLLLWTFWRISGDIRLALVAAFTPAVIYNFAMAQTAALVTSMLGLALFHLPRRPLISAAFITALTFKPHFGLAIPPALLFGRRWTALAAATAGTLVIIAAIYLWNPVIFPAFLSEIQYGYDHYIRAYEPHGYKLQSFYAILRWCGLNDRAASIAQFVCAIAAVCALAWAQMFSSNIRAAVVVLATLAMTPFVQAYDLSLTTLALVFLYRDGAFDLADEVIASGVIALTWIVSMWPEIPAGPAAVVLCGCLVWRRVRRRGNPDVQRFLFQPTAASQ